jgi:delta14-sterol reductase
MKKVSGTFFARVYQGLPSWAEGAKKVPDTFFGARRGELLAATNGGGEISVAVISFYSLGLAVLLVGSFVAALFLGSILVPGPVREGPVLPDGHRRQYKLNGLALFGLVVLLVAVNIQPKLFSLAILVEYFWSLFLVANAFAFALTVLLFLEGRRSRAQAGERDHRGLGQTVRDLFYGSESNPTWLGVDLKLFSYRPSLLGLGLLNASFAFLQYETYGTVTPRMWLYQVLWLAYLFNYFQFEYGMLYTWDIVVEHFGWMLVWGDYVLVPFFYSLAGWYLVDQLEPLAPAVAFGLVALYLIGFILFRGANEQKHQFKTNPGTSIWGKPAEAIGGKLLVSGFWGIGRKLNYTGELCMYSAWTLTCGGGSLVPYLVPLWLTVLLSHRAWRDEQRCRVKYGELWAAYRRRARFRMIPFLY